MLTRSQSRRVKLTEAHVDLGDGDSLNIVFDRNAITPAWIDHAKRQAEDEADAYALAAALADVIASWDLFEDDGQTPVPATREELGTLSFDTCASLLGELVSASHPSRAEGNDSSGPPNTPPSASTGQPQAHLNGEGVSPSPTPSASPSLT